MRTTRLWHPDFIKYMNFIVQHDNYKSLPNKFKKNGEIRWVSPSDKLRATWWDRKIVELGCINRADVARKIHPKELKGLKPCQICGKKLSIFYIYPNKSTLRKLNSVAPEFQFTPFKEDIDEILSILVSSLGDNGIEEIKLIFNIPATVKSDKNSILKFIKENCKAALSPGVMSNPPDRLDGFHTYNACCRSLEDTGRHRSNLARYSQDRRVYENWAEGNWNLSNRLMGEFNRYSLDIKCPGCGKLRKMTADHIGPISLGFTQRPRFQPLCRACNSKKNNRMTYQDIQTLIKDEENGSRVISWHSKYIWDALKHKVKDQSDALLLSKLMRVNLHHVLTLFSKISESGHNTFLLKYLHPEYSLMDYKFLNFHPLHGPKRIIEKPLLSKNKEKNAKRYIRISFESLEEYRKTENRNTKIWNSKKIDQLVKELITDLRFNQDAKAEFQLNDILQQLSLEAEVIFDANSSRNIQ